MNQANEQIEIVATGSHIRKPQFSQPLSVEGWMMNPYSGPTADIVDAIFDVLFPDSDEYNFSNAGKTPAQIAESRGFINLQVTTVADGIIHHIRS